MNEPAYSPVWEMTKARLKEFFREPAAVFWTYGFPLVLSLALGIAFRERPIERISVDLFETSEILDQVQELEEKLKADPRLQLHRISDANEWKQRLRSGKSDLVVTLNPSAEGKMNYDLWEEPNRPESVLALNAVQNVLLKQARPASFPELKERKLEETGVRYIDFLIPGLIGMNLMSGGLWGVGFVTVDLRVRKLLKRFLATPMKPRHFLFSIMLSRLIFTIPEVLLLLTFGYLIFGVKVAGSILSLAVVFLIGAACFSGVGLLVASRAKTVETVSGLMNLVMLPMFVLSGVFFSSDRFPEAAQPVIQALPLTALNQAIRGVMLDGNDLIGVLPQLTVLAIWGLVTFPLALKIFRWR